MDRIAGGGRVASVPVPALLLAVAVGLASHVGTQAASTASTATTVVRSAESGALIPRRLVVRRTLRTDASQEYLLYVPGTGGQGAPIFISMHGISCNVEEHATLFAPYAERRGVVLVAPDFPPDAHDDFQRLGRKGRGPRTDLVLDAIVEEVEALTGARGSKIYLFGFSGGAQFAHRYTMAHPERVARAAVAAAGWYTFPDSGIPYPYGIGPSGELEGVRFDPGAFLRVPIAVFVGTADTGSENLRRNTEVDQQQGATRRERAQSWAAAMRRAAKARGEDPLVTCELVPRIEHSFKQFMLEGGLGDKVFGALFGHALSVVPQPEEPVTSQRRTGSH